MVRIAIGLDGCTVNELSANRVFVFASDDRMRRLPTSLAR
jgi:hypothetical protein